LSNAANQPDRLTATELPRDCGDLETLAADQANEIRRLRKANARLAAENARLTGVPQTPYPLLAPEAEPQGG
jgi:hypothetical protein